MLGRGRGSAQSRTSEVDPRGQFDTVRREPPRGSPYADTPPADTQGVPVSLHGRPVLLRTTGLGQIDSGPSNPFRAQAAATPYASPAESPQHRPAPPSRAPPGGWTPSPR